MADPFHAHFEKGEPDAIAQLNTVRPTALKRVLDFVKGGMTLEDILKATKEKAKSAAKGTSDFRKYQFLVGVVSEVIAVRDLAKKGDELARMKLVNWKFIIQGGKKNGD